MDRPPEYMDALFKMFPGKWCWSFPSGVIEYENMVWRGEDIPKPTKESIAKVYEELLREHPWKNLREERNRRLAEVDWVFSGDYKLSPEEHALWVTYRKTLRELPSTTEDPANPTWPEKPSVASGETAGVQANTEVQLLRTLNENLRNEHGRLSSKVTTLERRSTEQELILIQLKRRLEKM